MSMTKTIMKSIGAAGVALVAMSGAALAQDKLEWSVTGTGTSDYVFRGLSLNDEDPAFQASFDLTYGIWYTGLWGTMADGDGFAPVELNWYAGVKPVWGPVTFDFGFVYYFFPWANNLDGDKEIVELKAGAEFSPIKNLTLTPVFWYVPDQDNSDAIYTIEGTAAYELPAFGIFTPTISAGVGYSEGDAFDTFGEDIVTDNYTYWNAGISLAVEKFTFDFRYWDTDMPAAASALADERFVFTASVTLP